MRLEPGQTGASGGVSARLHAPTAATTPPPRHTNPRGTKKTALRIIESRDHMIGIVYSVDKEVALEDVRRFHNSLSYVGQTYGPYRSISTSGYASDEPSSKAWGWPLRCWSKKATR